MAPAVIQLNSTTTAADVWAIGCTAIELITGTPVYHNLHPMQALFTVGKDPHPPLPQVPFFFLYLFSWLMFIFFFCSFTEYFTGVERLAYALFPKGYRPTPFCSRFAQSSVDSIQFLYVTTSLGLSNLSYQKQTLCVWVVLKVKIKMYLPVWYGWILLWIAWKYHIVGKR